MANHYVDTLTDKVFEETKARILKLKDKWIKNLGLGFWTIDFEYNTVIHDPEEKGFLIWMTVGADWSRMQATINFNMCSCADLTDEKLEACFVHELMHILVNEMREDDPKGKHEERVVESLTNAMLWAVDLIPKWKGDPNEENIKAQEPHDQPQVTTGSETQVEKDNQPPESKQSSEKVDIKDSNVNETPSIDCKASIVKGSEDQGEDRGRGIEGEINCEIKDFIGETPDEDRGIEKPAASGSNCQFSVKGKFQEIPQWR